MSRSHCRRAASSVAAVLVAVLAMVALLPPGQAVASPASAPDSGPPPPIVEESAKPFDGTFSSGLRRQTWGDSGPHAVIVNAPSTVLSVPAGAHDSLEVDLVIDQGDGHAQGSYGIGLEMAVVASGAAPAALDWQGIFESHAPNSTERADDVRLTWDHRVAPAQAMDLHVRCHTVSLQTGDGCTIADIRGFEDTPGGWDPVAWNGVRSHAFGTYAEEMPLTMGDYGPRITSDGDANPFLGVERDLSGNGVRLRGPLVTLPEFTETAPLSATIRWRRTTDAVPPDSSVELVVRFMPIDNPWSERTLIVIPRSASTDWQTQVSGPLRTELSGRSGHFVIEPVDSSLGPNQAVGLDSLTFYLDGRAVEVPLTPCVPGPDNVVIYEHTYYQGRCVVRTYGAYNPSAFTPLLDDSASSIRVGDNVEAILASGENLSGAVVQFMSNVVDLNNDARLGNDAMSSFHVGHRSHGTMTIWMNAFIPRDVKGLSAVVPDGPYVGQTMVHGPLGRCFLTDNRDFSSDVLASKRLQSRVTIDVDTGQILEQSHGSNPSIRVNCYDGSVVCDETASPRDSNFIVTGHTETNILLKLEAGTNNACFAGSPWIDYEGTFNILRADATGVWFNGKVEKFPNYEMYVSMNGGEPRQLFTEPFSGSPEDLWGSPDIDVSGGYLFELDQ